jgi:hypothetical protein
MDIMHEQTVFFEPFLLPSLHPPISVQKYILKKKKGIPMPGIEPGVSL